MYHIVHVRPTLTTCIDPLLHSLTRTLVLSILVNSNLILRVGIDAIKFNSNVLTDSV